MRQRVMIAMALACEPKLLIADEPTTALDVTIQAQVLDLMRTLRQETGTAIILITHDLGVVAELADEVVVMYSGRIVERAPVQRLFDHPQHPYTIGLLGSIPSLHLEQERLHAIDGQVPTPMTRVQGCRFAPRCPFAVAKCREEDPPLLAMGEGQEAACWRAPLDELVQLPASGAGGDGMSAASADAAARGKPGQAFPDPPAHVRPPDRRGARGGRRELRAARRRHHGAGGRIGLRQVHRRPAGAAPAGRHLGQGLVRRRGPDGAVAAGAARQAARAADDLPGPVFVAQSAHDGGADAGRAAGAAWARARAGIASGRPS